MPKFTLRQTPEELPLEATLHIDSSGRLWLRLKGLNVLFIAQDGCLYRYSSSALAELGLELNKDNRIKLVV